MSAYILSFFSSFFASQTAVFGLDLTPRLFVDFCRRHCLWILGNSTTLAGGKTIWREIVADAKNRSCFFEAKDDKDLSNAIIKAVIELDEEENLLKLDGLRIGGSRPGV